MKVCEGSIGDGKDELVAREGVWEGHVKGIV